MTDQKQRALEVALALANIRADYLQRGIKTDPGVRAGLEVEAADLALQRYNHRKTLLDAKTEASKLKANAYLKALIQKVKDAGLDHLIEQAHQESLAEVESAGLMDIYRSRP